MVSFYTDDHRRIRKLEGPKRRYYTALASNYAPPITQLQSINNLPALGQAPRPTPAGYDAIQQATEEAAPVPAPAAPRSQPKQTGGLLLSTIKPGAATAIAGHKADGSTEGSVLAAINRQRELLNESGRFETFNNPLARRAFEFEMEFGGTPEEVTQAPQPIPLYAGPVVVGPGDRFLHLV